MRILGERSKSWYSIAVALVVNVELEDHDVEVRLVQEHRSSV